MFGQLAAVFLHTFVTVDKSMSPKLLKEAAKYFDKEKGRIQFCEKNIKKPPDSWAVFYGWL
jgi:hypothetical protein